VDKVVIDSFTISILTAILLKALLDIVQRLEHRVAHFFETRPGTLSKFLRILSIWLILFLSKCVILEAVDFVFGDLVELGGFVTVLILVFVMMIASQIVNRVYVNLGPSQSAAAEST
jgi:DMSO reductase anchor subunit